METLLLKMMLSWAIMIIGFVALFAGCNNVKTQNPPVGSNSNVHDSVLEPAPDITNTEGLKDKHLPQDTASVHTK